MTDEKEPVVTSEEDNVEVDLDAVKASDEVEKQEPKEVEKEVKRDFFVRRPNRKLYDDAELYYAVKLSEGIKAGLLTKALLEKRWKVTLTVRSKHLRKPIAELMKKAMQIK